MKAWRGIPVLVSVLWGGLLAVGCGPAVDGVDAEGEAAVESARADVVAAGRACTSERVMPSGTKPEWLVRGVDRLFFSADSEGQGRELWSSPGGGGCAGLVKDLRAGAQGSVPRYLTALGRWVLFAADDGLQGPELWRTDGTEAGTVRVLDVWPGERGSAPRALTRVGTHVYFLAEAPGNGQELWRTDGTASGTRRVHAFVPGSDVLQLTAWGERLALVSYDAEAAVLWVVEPGGETREVFRSAVGVFDSLTAVERRLFFVRDTGEGVVELWVVSGRQPVATKVRDFSGGAPSELTALGGQVFFHAGSDGNYGELGDTRHGGELWRSDGTTLGTRMVRDIWPGPKGSLPSDLVAMDGVLYFAAEDGWRGRELWRSDGTALGTWMVWDLQWGPESSEPRQLVAQDGWLFFSATTAAHGREAWKSDGWLWNTRQLTDIAPGASSSNPRSFVRSGRDVFFLANEAAVGEALWVLPLHGAWPCAGPRGGKGC
ncbi:ELWxxDGT repeat protein [Myxococcus fulvus]|uniref:ELWxxDGT repeat protein n=1 Tax=Myxococcus fulvus TaxID=33 RepID=UPI0020BF7C1E|nr:ELWxxDGT repeat protein [Myxococcus fulvus]MCK8500571.1 hypothetical protein [Myxococcus fulvus]